MNLPFNPLRNAVLAAALACPALAQSTWHVDQANSAPGSGSAADPFSSITLALDSASTLDGDTILVAPGIYSEGFLQISKTVSIVGVEGPLQTHIRDTGVRLGTEVGDSPTLEGFSISSEIAVGRMVTTERGTLRRCIIHDYYGGDGFSPSAALFIWDEATVEHTVVVGNAEGISGFGFGFGLFMSNSIVWANGGGDDASWGDIRYSAGSPPRVWGQTTTGLVSGDPGMWGWALGDYRLRPGSRCIDAGDPVSDPDGDGSIADIGAVTHDPTIQPATYSFCESTDHSGPYFFGAHMAMEGDISVAANDFHLAATYCPPAKTGQFFYGGGEIQVPFGNGFRCVGGMGGTQRLFPFGQTDEDGFYSHRLDFTAHPAAAGSFAIVAGSTWKFQFWFRDGMVGVGHNLTDGLSVTFEP